MKKTFPAFLTAAVLVSGIALGADPSPATISPLRKGQPAPYTGVLFSQAAAASVVAEMNAAQDKIRIEVDAAVKAEAAKREFDKREVEVQCTADKARSEALTEADKARISSLERDLKEARQTGLSSATWLGIGVAGGFVATVVVVFALNSATK